MRNTFIIIFAVLLSLAKAEARNIFAYRDKFTALSKIFYITDSIDLTGRDTTVNVFTRFDINIKRRNFLLGFMPSMYAIAKGRRNYSGNKSYEMTIVNGNVTDVKNLSSKGDIPFNKDVVSIMKIMLIPRLYRETVYEQFILSPFARVNRKLYDYKEWHDDIDNCTRIEFKPRFSNVQLVSGEACIDSCGVIQTVRMKGILDMVKFDIALKMQKQNFLLPEKGESHISFSFVGNRIKSAYFIDYKNDMANDDGMTSDNRAITAAPNNERIANGYLTDTLTVKRETTDKSDVNTVVNDSVKTKSLADKRKSDFASFIKETGGYLLERLRGNFGSNGQGTYRISPIINPLYLGYSNRKGVTYRIKLNGRYKFTSNVEVSAAARLGYSFKLKQFYTNIPVKFSLGKKLTMETEFGTGNHIVNSEILEQIKHEHYDSVRWDKLNLDLFKDMYWKYRIGYKFSPYLSMRAGIAYHKRTAVNKADFVLTGKKTDYHSFAPTLQLSISPWLELGPVITTDYERGVKGIMHSDMDYERMEIDVSWKKRLSRLKILSTRIGYGMYTSRSKGCYFLDYTNFKYQSIPGGWDDDWTGEFQLLNQNWYNASKFYARANLTFESPMLLVSRLPFIGRFIETERIYGNILFTDKLHPYVEYGYGLTNRLFSVGVFCGVSNKTYEGLGVRFSLELFREW